MIAKSHRWQKTASALAAAALLGLWGTNAAALSLGRITVQSALGEPLRAEIDVPDINAEEANTLNARVASPDAFQSAGLEYNPVMPGLQVSLQRRSDGRAYFRLTSTQAVNDPFVDLILEANWASGRIVRDYTLLFDPPNLKSAAPSTTAAQLPAQASASKAANTTTAAPATPTSRPAAPAKAVTAKPVASVNPPKPEEKTDTQVTVKTGDTAGRIASNAKPSNVSLDQMLVALLRANPEAFVGGNINRIRAGSVLELPTAEKAQATPATEATQIIVAQSKDFNDFRRKLAGSAPSTQVAEADKKASGSVQTKVEEKKPAAATPDKLTLSKGNVQGKPAADKLAKEGNAKEAAGRTAEIAKNISDLNKLSAASSTVTAGAVPAPKTASAPVATIAVPVVAPVIPVPVASAPVAPVSAPAPAPAPVASKPAEAAVIASAPKPTVTASAKKPAVTPETQPEPGLLDGLLNDPLVPMGAGGLLALLAGWGLYRFKQKRDADKAEKDAMDSRLQPESFFGTSGGQSVDTNDRGGGSSSMAYSPSQLDAVDDVDPVAEADVYLAYGRDLQAEEILKEALRTNPTRVAIHQKLCEIFAKRNDTKSYEDIASQAFKLTNGTGPDWQRICEGGLNIDPSNVLYQPGGQPDHLDDSAALPLAGEGTLNLASDPEATVVVPAVPSKADANGVDLDLDLDFSIEDEPAISEALPSHELSTVIQPRKSAADMHDLDFGMSTVTMEPFVTPQPTTAHDADATLPLITPAHPSDSFRAQAATSFGTTEPAPLSMTTDDSPLEKDHPSTESGMLEFDLGGLSLDLGGTSPAPLDNPVVEPPEDPLGTKLALAEEFSAIGDDDGARALIEEVIMEATGDMKIKAQRALNNL